MTQSKRSETRIGTIVASDLIRVNPCEGRRREGSETLPNSAQLGKQVSIS